MLNKLRTWTLESASLLLLVSVGMAGCGTDADLQPTDADDALGAQPAPVSAQVADGTCSAGSSKSTFASYTNIPGYQRLTKPPTTGPYEPTLEVNAGYAEWTIYRPKDLGDTKHPVVIWGNGGCLKNGTLMGQFPLELASHGMVVLVDGKVFPATADPIAGGIRDFGGGGAGPMLATLDWLTIENERACSPLYHKLDLTKVGVSGQSCGGMMALPAAGDKRVTTALINNSGLFQRDAKVYAALHTPIAFLIGGPSDMAYKNAEADIKAINTVPIFYANNPVNGHQATWDKVNAGEFGRVGLGWMKWQLLGDAASAKMFVGADCELCKAGSKWTVKKKNMD